MASRLSFGRARPAIRRTPAALLRIAALAAVLPAVLAAGPAVLHAEAGRVIEAPENGTVRALVIGIDHYHAVAELKGAVNDARDIEQALRTMGARDVTALVDDAAERAAVLAALDALVARAAPGDLVILSLAGHGSKEPEHVKGSSRDGMDEVFLLPRFDPHDRGAAGERVLNHEFKHYIKALEDRGAQVLFVADTCYGGGLVRAVAPGSPDLVFRQVARYRLIEDDLKPVSTPAEAVLGDFAFRKTTFLAAVDSDTKAPEVVIDGQHRGALSYAVARAIEGRADEASDGRITKAELFGYVRKTVYQMSDQRQNVVTPEPPGEDPTRSVVLRLGAARQGEAPPPKTVVGALPGSGTALTRPPAGEAPPGPAVPIRVASRSMRTGVFDGLRKLQSPFEIVAADADPDILWDPVNRQAFSGGDAVAYDVTLDVLPGVIDRTAALRAVKGLVARSGQDMILRPQSSVFAAGSIVDVEVASLEGRSLVLVDLTGTGIVQQLYPVGEERPAPHGAAIRRSFRVRDPFGADEIVAVSSAGSLAPLQAALRELDGRRSAGQLAAVIARFAPEDARFGVIGLFTTP